MKKPMKKLSLNRETLQRLNQKDTEEIGAGMAAPSGGLFGTCLIDGCGYETDTARMNTCCSRPYCSKW